MTLLGSSPAHPNSGHSPSCLGPPGLTPCCCFWSTASSCWYTAEAKGYTWGSWASGHMSSFTVSEATSLWMALLILHTAWSTAGEDSKKSHRLRIPVISAALTNQALLGNGFVTLLESHSTRFKMHSYMFQRKGGWGALKERLWSNSGDTLL